MYFTGNICYIFGKAIDGEYIEGGDLNWLVTLARYAVKNLDFRDSAVDKPWCNREHITVINAGPNPTVLQIVVVHL